MSESSLLCYFNGRIQPVSETSVGVNDLGLTRGYGIFDYGRTYNGKLFHFDDNIARFRRSAAELFLDIPLSDGEITQIAQELVEKSKLQNAGIKFLLTGGYANYTPDYESPNFIMLIQELPELPIGGYKTGIKIMTAEYQRELPHVKTTNYINALRLEPLKRQRGVDNIVYYSEHGVTEAPRSNFFIFKDSTLITASDHILEGITRKVILQIAPEQFKVEVRRVEFEELFTADEAFITSTGQRILPVVEIDGQPVGKGVIGPCAKKLMLQFEVYINGL